MLLLNRIWLEVKKFLRENPNGFRENWSKNSQILTILRVIGEVHAKKSRRCTIVRRFLQGIWFHKQRENGVNSIMVSPKKRVRYNDKWEKPTKQMVTPTSLNIVNGVSQRSRLAPYCLSPDHTTYSRIRRYPTETKTDIRYSLASHKYSCLPNSCCIAYRKQQKALTSTRMHIEYSSCILNKKVLSPS